MRLHIQRFEGREELGRFQKGEGRIYFKVTAQLTLTPQEQSIVDKYDMLQRPLAVFEFIHIEQKFNKKKYADNFLVTLEMLLEGVESKQLVGYQHIHKIAVFIKELQEGCQKLKDNLDVIPRFAGESDDEIVSSIEEDAEEIDIGEVLDDAKH